MDIRQSCPGERVQRQLMPYRPLRDECNSQPSFDSGDETLSRIEHHYDVQLPDTDSRFFQRLFDYSS